ISVGPWGGQTGARWDDGVYTAVRQVIIFHGAAIDSVQFEYDKKGSSVWSEKHGGTGGIKTNKIGFDYPSEILTHITGYYGSTFSRGPTIIRSITFHTNRRKYGPFGDEQGTCFTSGSNNGKIVGFHGRKGNFLDSIGVHVMEGTKSLSRPLIEPPATWRSEAWGGERGKDWDDGVFNGVKRIFLTRGEAIYCIQVQYESNGGQFVWSPRHGSGSEGNSQMIKFDYPQEFLTAVTGYHGSLTGDEKSEAIHCLTFYTNKGKYGPYGKETGTFFTSGESKGKIVGFHGRSGCYLNALGVHFQQQQHQSSSVTHRDLEPLMAGDSGGGRASKVIVGKFIKSNIF
ncbi:Jacalin-related lectin 3, partial [Linum perenne]